MIAGEFDLSVAPMSAMSAYLYAAISVGADSLIKDTLLSFGLPIQDGNVALAILFALGVPSLMGAFNGWLRIQTNIPSFIVTLGTRQIYRGVVWIVAGGTMLQVIDKPAIYGIFNGRFDLLNNLPLWDKANFRTAMVWLLLAVIIFQLIVTRTRFGNHLFAVGGNEGASVAQGVRKDRVRLLAFTISGLMAGMAGIISFSQFGSVRVAQSAGVELTAIAAAVIGGTMLTGGYGSVWGALIGILTIGVLRSGIILLKIPFIPADNFLAVVGVTIVAAVVFNHYLRTRVA